MGRLSLVLLLLLPLAARAGGQTPAPASLPASAGAATDERLRRVRERREAIARDLARLRGQERSLLAEVERLELEVQLRAEQLRETQLVLHRTNEQMDATVRRLGELEASVARARPQLAARARALYKLGELSYLRMLLSVERPSDMLRGSRFVSALARRDRERMATLRADLAAMARTREDLQKKTREALALRALLDRTRRGLDSDRKRKSELLRSLVEKKETHAAYLEELLAAEAKLGQLLSGLAEGEVAVPITVFKGALAWPAAGPVRSTFGRHKHPRFDTYTLHNGIEIAAPVDTPVAAVHDGTVAFADQFLGYGLLVILDHGGRNYTLYAHLAESRVRTGQHVAAGALVGTVGASSVEGPGLYFEVRSQGKPQDPLEWLAREPRRTEASTP
ncbi:MAG TPA: peptidoglycan DD-metalloendopeptidase family protein [Vicinamibacteria bacterium]|nr:peptidoglycan DD-metalloendopeptidase family protein [Vicinamibacteria bacterium]